jgi:transposase
MTSGRRSYPPEFREEAVRLVREHGLTPTQAAKNLPCHPETIRNWVRQAEIDEGKSTAGLSTDERAELARLRRQIRVLEQEKEILKKAAAWFAKETHSTP